MAHECCICGGECYCNGSWDDVITDQTPESCEGCNDCQDDDALRHFYSFQDDDDFDENDWYEDEE
ncbi:hypothetical protein SAMN04515674_104249 [Pseudarcicella hirudinis]|uniref:Uncharacterized protein n=1 Tax=Pseudarcicella hirudinis TaxID=1079859 RepID=A0A1I5RU72_9BACT|nr:hypothetical protein [Pseudarcicella hirudinis]SFP62109.1 hypothetical protein SAMN04515674_104249 [Pseudarcicella hirudinis]